MTGHATCLALVTASLIAAGGGALGEEAATAPAVPGHYLDRAPLERLTETRARPLFVPTRRAPAPPPAPVPVAPPPAPPVADEPPPFTLVGVIRTNGSAAVAVVVDGTTRQSVTLKPGDTRQGWAVDAVDATSLTLRRDEQTVRLTFPAIPNPPLLGPPPGPGPDD